MLRQRGSRTHPDQRADRGRERPQRVSRPGVECLEGRQVLSAITEFPLPTPGTSPGPLTVGPDGNLWFPDGTAGDRPDHARGRRHRVPAPHGRLCAARR